MRFGEHVRQFLVLGERPPEGDFVSSNQYHR